MNKISHTLCPDKLCGSSDAYTEYSAGGKCYSCGRWFPHEKSLKPCSNSKTEKMCYKFTIELPDSAKAYLYQFGINDSQIEEFDIVYEETSQRIKLGPQLRAFQKNRKPKSITIETPERLTWIGRHLTRRGPVVLVEDFISAIKVSKAYMVVCLFGTHLNKKKLQELITSPHATEYLIWLDPDSPGVKAAKELKTRLSAWKRTSIVYSKKDPKEYTTEEIYRLCKIHSAL